MISKDQLERLAQRRLEEALCLVDSSYWDGGYYLAGYAVELAFKAVIANKFEKGVIPDRGLVDKVYSHDLTKLRDIAELKIPMLERAKEDKIFASNWEYVAKWSELARYDTIDEVKAMALVEALRNPSHGVFEWIKLRW